MKSDKTKFQIHIYSTPSEYQELKKFFETMPIEIILNGIRFSYNRYTASIGGFLNPGRKSIIKRETYLLSKKQVKFRLKNWKIMVKKYRDKGYSYPTISRIKKRLIFMLED